MTPRDAYAALSDHGRRISALEGAATILSWDQETMMPPRGGAQRAESRGVNSRSRRIDRMIGRHREADELQLCWHIGDLSLSPYSPVTQLLEVAALDAGEERGGVAGA